MKQLVALATQLLATSTSPAVKQTVTKMLCEIYKRMGNSLRSQLTDIKPALLNAISKEFDKLTNVKPAVPSRSVKTSSRYSNFRLFCLFPSHSSAGTGSNSNSDATLLSVLSSGESKQRLSALTKISQTLNSGSCFSIDENFYEALTRALSDPNKQVVTAAVNLLAFTVSPEKEIVAAATKSTKRALPTLLSLLSDSNDGIQRGAVGCLDKIADVFGISYMLPEIASHISQSAKEELFQWMNKRCADIAACDNAQSVVGSTLLCLSDISYGVRQHAEVLTEELVRKRGLDYLTSELIRLPSVHSKQASLVLARISEHGSQQSQDRIKEGDLFRIPGNKEARLNTNRQKPWPKTQIKASAEEVSLLRSEMRECVSPDLHPKLFSLDSKMWSEGLSILSDSTSKYPQSTIENLDVILKWLTWKLAEAHSASDDGIHNGLIQFVKHLFSMLDFEHYRLRVEEIEIFVYPFIDIIGSGERIGERRIKMAECLKILPKVYPVEGLFNIYADCLRSASTSKYGKLVCLQEIKSLFDGSGLAACNPAVHLPLIASYLNDSDVKLKSGALTVLYVVHRRIGSDIWKYLSAEVSQHRTLLEKKFQSAVLTPSTPRNATHAPPLSEISPRFGDVFKSWRKEGRPEASLAQTPQHQPQAIKEQQERTKLMHELAREQREREAREQAHEQQERTRQQIRDQRERESREKEAREVNEHERLAREQVRVSEQPRPKIEDYVCEMPEPTSLSPAPRLEKKTSSLSLLLSRTDSLLTKSLSLDMSAVPPTFDLELEKIEADTSAVPASPCTDKSTGYLSVASQLSTETPILPSRQIKHVVTSPADNVSLLIKQLNNCKDGVTKIQVYRTIAQFINENESTTGLALDALVIALALHLDGVFKDEVKDPRAPTHRVCRYLVTALATIFSKRTLAQSFTESAASGLIQSLLSCILSERLETIEDGLAVKHCFNDLMMRIMENVERTTCLLILLKVWCLVSLLLTP